MKVDLFYKDSRSDKEYHLELTYTNLKGYSVWAQFGKRGGPLTHVDLTKGSPTTYSEAVRIFRKREEEKRAKGYTDISNTGLKIRDRLKNVYPTSVPFLLLTDWSRIGVVVDEMIKDAIEEAA